MFQQLSLSNFYKKTALKLIYSGHKDEVEESGESHLVTSLLLSQCNWSLIFHIWLIKNLILRCLIFIEVVNAKEIISTRISDPIAGPSDDFHCTVCLNVMILDSWSLSKTKTNAKTTPLSPDN